MANILLIDDDEILRDTVRQMLEIDRHQVTDAADGAVGLREFSLNPKKYDLVISDIIMPGMDGSQTIVEMRRIDKNVPIVAISGGRRTLSPQFSLETAHLVGATYELAKPFTLQELREAVKTAMNTRG